MSAAPLIDAYCHVGWPRFGDADACLRFLDAAGIGRAVVVHGPGVRDGAAFEALARSAAAERLRFVTVPAEGDDDRTIGAFLDWGVIGLRLQGEEYLAAIAFQDRIGARGGFLFAVDPQNDPAHARRLLDWLEAWPEGRAVLPHFLKPDPSLLDAPGMAEILTHERVFLTLSRQSGQSREGAPHRDLWPWMTRLAEAGALSRALWASEYPVFTWRGEPVSALTTWFEASGLIPAADRAALLGGRAEALFFGPGTAGGDASASLPRTELAMVDVPLPGFALPQPQQAQLFAAYMAAADVTRTSFHDWLRERLA